MNLVPMVVEKEFNGKLGITVLEYTNDADKGYIEAFLEGTKLDKYFKGHLAAGDTNLAKWQNINLLQEKEKIDRVIYVGDTNKDKIESLKANAMFIHAAYGFGIIENDEYKINSLDELPDLIDNLFNK